AGSRLLRELGDLEKQGETYVVVGHSHGGSVISAALLEAAARNIKLEGMKRWITIGTPFVELRRERFLFLRLPLLLKAMFVASLMLLFMYLFNVFAELLDGRVNLNNERQLTLLFVSTVLTAIPFAVFYLIALLVDRRQLFFYRKRNRERARNQFADRWIALSHEDDEAVRGLSSLSRLQLKIFNRDFAVPVLSLMSVFILPLIYLYVVMSPTLMIQIASFLKDDVYQIQAYADKERSVEQMLRTVRRTTRQIRSARSAMDETDDNPARRLELESQLKDLTQRRRDLRRQMNQQFPELTQIRRAVRFERRFLQENGKPCADGQLCGKGYNILLNAKLLFHLVTDEVSSWVIDRGVGRGIMSRVVRSAVPVLLVPVVFGIAAVIMVLIVQYLARQFSRIASGWFDRQTWAEIRRNAVGNDTEAEVAVGAVPAPPWLDRKVAFLPAAVGGDISEHSDRAMSESISKIRNSISEFALGEGPDGQIGSALNYLSWQELIHTSYFEVPAFQKLVARAIVSGDGFKPTSAFQADPQFDLSGQWLQKVEASSSGDD
ncbi:MAG: hypothetical protein ACR2OV_02435, partial [Hyphomicrobiaceae bacterium]